MSTHSPYFLQHVPLRDIRLVRLRDGSTEVTSLPHHIVSDLPWNEKVDGFINGRNEQIFFRDELSKTVAAKCSFDEEMERRLLRCYRKDPELSARTEQVRQFRYASRLLVSSEEEEEFGFHSRRVRGEIFFARHWILVEGVTEYLLVHALGKALGWSLDTHGVAVIDFQQSGNAGIFPALAEAFGIPWNMIVDGDQQAEKFRRQIISRGFSDDDLTGHFMTLTVPNDLEDQLISDGHEQLLREILASISGSSALNCPIDEFRARLKNRKTGYMGVLSIRVAEDEDLARRMPAPFVDLICSLRGDAV